MAGIAVEDIGVAAINVADIGVAAIAGSQQADQEHNYFWSRGHEAVVRIKNWATAFPGQLKASIAFRRFLVTTLHLVSVFFFLLITAVFFKWRLQVTKQYDEPRPFNGMLGDTIGEGFYWAATTVMTVGYGDIIPNTDEGRIGTCLVLLFGLIVMTMATHTLNEAWSDLEDKLLDVIIKCHRGYRRYLFTDDRGRKIFMRRIFAVLYAGVCLALGMVLFHRNENMSIIDSLYASVASATTLGYGDMTLSTKLGRALAPFWLVFATSSLARVYELQTEARLHRRSMKLLEEEFTLDQLENEGLLPNENGLNAFIVFKLRKAKKFDEKDMLIITQQFQKFIQAADDRRRAEP